MPAYFHDDDDDPDAPQPEDLRDLASDDEDDDEADVGEVYSFRRARDAHTIRCPNCGRTLHEDAAVCPACGEWIIDESLAAQRSRGWRWPLIVGGLIAMILVIWHGLR